MNGCGGDAVGNRHATDRDALDCFYQVGRAAICLKSARGNGQGFHLAIERPERRAEVAGTLFTFYGT